ncbi:MAG: hypothetical protein GY899_09015 [Verrucomicrobiaceae bacterium]|nr:hypothetical protein [Verrucomicrobiaceae bacterium]
MNWKSWVLMVLGASAFLLVASYWWHWEFWPRVLACSAGIIALQVMGVFRWRNPGGD